MSEDLFLTALVDPTDRELKGSDFTLSLHVLSRRQRRRFLARVAEVQRERVASAPTYRIPVTVDSSLPANTVIVRSAPEEDDDRV